MILIFIFTGSLLLLPRSSYPSAFLIYNQDAKSNGMGLAVVASIDNPSSVFFNPSKLPFLENIGFSVNMTTIMNEMSYRDQLSGEDFRSKERFHNIYSLYAYSRLGDFLIGFGMFSPFGLSTRWGDDFPGRYYATYSLLKTVFFNPVIAWKVSPKSSVAFGISYIRGSVRFDSHLPIQPQLSGILKLKGEGDSMGINFAIYREFGEDYSLGISFRSPSKIKFSGTGKLFLGLSSQEIVAETSTKFTLPHVVTMGIAKKFPRTILELDLLHTGWAQTGNYSIKSEGGIFDRSVRKRWKNTTSFSFGVNHKVKNDLQIRAGYMYDISPVPDSTRGPELPDSSRNILSLGGTYSFSGKNINLCYQATYFKRAKSSLLGLEGHYRNFAHLILISLDYAK